MNDTKTLTFAKKGLYWKTKRKENDDELPIFGHIKEGICGVL